jgi:hypothetical protein
VSIDDRVPVGVRYRLAGQTSWQGCRWTVAFNQAVGNPNRAMRETGDFWIVGNQNHRDASSVQLLEHLEDFDTCNRI